jgi:TATA-binding protein-associated factor Taf7
MDTDEQPLILHQHRWSLQLKSGEKKIPLPPQGEKGVQPLCVTDFFLVDLENTATQGAVAVCIETSTGNRRMLALLSAERPSVELRTPVVLDGELRFYLMWTEGHSDDADVGEVVVQIEGIMLRPLSSLDTNEELEGEEEGHEEAASSEDDDDRSDSDYEEDDENDDEDESDHVRPVAARTLLGLFLFTYMIAFFKLIM